MRRTIISAMCMAAVVLLAASCNKIEDDIVSVEGNGRTVINGVTEAIGTGTKADMAYCYEVIWRENDQIYVTEGTKDDTFTLTGGFDTNKGQFTEDNKKGISGNIEAFYPASLHTASGDYVWPATQSNNQVAPMYAKQAISGTKNEVVSFSSLGGMLQIVFNTKTEDITVTSITLQSNKKPLSGLFTVTDGQAIMAENSENPGVTLNLGESGVPVGVAAKYFYLAIPAGTYSTPEKDEVMTITFRDDVHGKECVMTSTTFPEVKRNTVGRITLAKDFQLQKRTVKFDMNGHGEAIQDTQVAYGQTFTAPSTPTAANYAFWCWCTDEDCTTPYDFSKPVTSDLTLYAKWTNGINGHAYVELAGYKWATETVGHCSDVTAVAGPGKSGNGWGFYYYNQSNASGAAQSWCSETDASQVTHTWTLPSEEQWQALIDSCYWEWTASYNYPTSPYNGKSGYIVYKAKSDDDKGQKNKENSDYTPATVNHLFLPAAGYYDGDSYGFRSQGNDGYYWSSVPIGYLYFGNGSLFMDGYYGPDDGVPVRPVSE